MQILRYYHYSFLKISSFSQSTDTKFPGWLRHWSFPQFCKLLKLSLVSKMLSSNILIAIFHTDCLYLTGSSYHGIISVTTSGISCQSWTEHFLAPTDYRRNFNVLLLDLVHGNYGNWSLSSACNVTCDEGFETWARNCNNPEPKFGGRNCSHLGEAIEYRPCHATPCPGK